jgi:hypothetical protein
MHVPQLELLYNGCKKASMYTSTDRNNDDDNDGLLRLQFFM